MMAGMATKSLGLEEGKGIRFYDFPDIKNNKAFIEEWYSEVNRLGFSEKESAALVEEANRVFTLNIGVFDELEGNALEAVAKFAFETFVEKLKIASPVVRAAIERESESESMSESAAA